MMNEKIELEIEGLGVYDFRISATGIISLSDGTVEHQCFIDESGMEELYDAMKEMFYDA